MTINGWIQIAFYCAIIIAITKPFGGYMTAVFNGERTFLSPLLRPLERALYAISGVDEKEDQHWLTYAIAMLAFTAAGFLSLGADGDQVLLVGEPEHGVDDDFAVGRVVEEDEFALGGHAQ